MLRNVVKLGQCISRVEKTVVSCWGVYESHCVCLGTFYGGSKEEKDKMSTASDCIRLVLFCFRVLLGFFFQLNRFLLWYWLQRCEIWRTVVVEIIQRTRRHWTITEEFGVAPTFHSSAEVWTRRPKSPSLGELIEKISSQFVQLIARFI